MVGLNCDLISLNTAGLRDYEKRRKVFHYLKQQSSKSAIIFMQETHTVKSDEKIWMDQSVWLWKWFNYFLTENLMRKVF